MAGRGKSDTLSPEADGLMRQYIVEDGLSYADAIKLLEARAIELGRPYRELAGYLRRQLMGHDR
jgi:hypothetical protein